MELNQELTPSEELQTKTSQELVLAPEVIESIEILQLPTADLRELIHSELETNPTLELEDETPDEDSFEEETLDREDEDDFDDDRLLEILEDQRGRNETFTGYNEEASDRKMEALYNTPARDNGLQEEIRQEIHLADQPEKIRRIAEFLAYNLDERGFVRVELDEAVELLNEEILTTAEEFLDRVREVRSGSDDEAPEGNLQQEIQNEEHEEMKRRLLNHVDEQGELKRSREEILDMERVTRWEAEQALDLIQSTGPPGLGARSKEECLLLQLDEEEEEEYDLKKRLISEHLEDVLENNLKAVSREMDIDVKKVKELADDLREMDLNPGFELSTEAAREVTPDVIVRKVNGEYEVEMNDSYVPQIAVSRKYLDLLRDDSLSTEAKDYVKKKLKSAKNLKSSIQQRRETIMQVAEEIVDRQKEFLDKGVNYLKPLKMEEVADEVGCHLSTVSRATDGKYMQTPWKVMPMKGFFTQGTASDGDGDGQSRVSIMNRIKTIIDNEDKSSPLSDSAIADKLEENHDIDISRRTVNKYRKELDIPSSTKRKEY